MDHLGPSCEIGAIAWPKVDAQFENSFADRVTVAEIAVLGGPNSMDDPGATDFVFQASKPGVEYLGALKDVHVVHCIRMDTNVQLSEQASDNVSRGPTIKLSGMRSMSAAAQC